MDVPEWSFGVGVERLAVSLLARDVCVDRSDKARLAKLAQHHAAESGLFEGRRAERNQRLGTSFLVAVLGCDRDPLRQHRQGAARLLVLRQRLPLALEHRMVAGWNG